MDFKNLHYVPCLRWKLGEYQAVLNLSDNSKGRITPLIEVPERGFDFEEKRLKNTIDKHVEKFAKRVKDKWGGKVCFVDTRFIDPNERMSDGGLPLEFVFADLRSKKCLAIPVTGIEKDQAHKTAINRIVSADERGLCIRLTLEDTENTNLDDLIEKILDENSLDASICDLVLDLRSPNFKPISGFSMLIVAITKKLPYLKNWRTFTLIGSSCPPSMSGIETGTTVMPRYE